MASLAEAASGVISIVWQTRPQITALEKNLKMVRMNRFPQQTNGGVREWLKRAVLKTARCNSLVSSNLTTSANKENRLMRGDFFVAHKMSL